jgi:nucleoside-diphosphate-sugar epimerase
MATPWLCQRGRCGPCVYSPIGCNSSLRPQWRWHCREGLPKDRAPLEEYGRGKNDIEQYLLHSAEAAASIPFACTILHAGHIVGRGWPPLNPQGHFNAQVFAGLARRQPLLLPHLGQETVHHIHADDIARCFIACIENRPASAGQAYRHRNTFDPGPNPDLTVTSC